jgi:hypothetical protein
MIEETWEDPEPKELIVEYLKKIFKTNNWSIDKNQIDLIAEFHLYNLIFAKSDLNLDNFKVNIFNRQQYLLTFFGKFIFIIIQNSQVKEIKI